MNKKYFKTPRMLMADAYTISGESFESSDAKEFSTYYLTFRKFPKTPGLYEEGDKRIVFAGLSRILDRLLYDKVTHEEIDEAVAFLENRKVMSNGSFQDFDFPEHLWRRIVDEFDGRIPIHIEAMPEGSVVYPNEPVIRVRNTVKGFGPLASWFESSIIHCWASTERLTAARHWLKYNKEMISNIETDANSDLIDLLASIMMHDFGARAAMTNQENEDIAYNHLYCFGGTDTFEAAYQAYKNGANSYTGSSVWALAHRIVQGFVEEKDCYNTIYENAPNNSLVSMVADCYDYYNAVENYLIPLAQKSKELNNGKVVVARPDSGNAKEQILWTLTRAEELGLFEERNGYKYMTTLRIIEGDGMSFKSMREINEMLIENKFAPHGCLIYGVGGYLRNSICRDNLSTKYALCSCGENERPVIKLSEVQGKRTLPNVKVLRDKHALENGVTIVNTEEPGEDALKVYYTYGSVDNNDNEIRDMNNYNLLCGCYDEDFETIQKRVLKDFDSMPYNAGFVSKDVERICGEIENNYKSTMEIS